jgi:D-sedoheptulose 7-phosphate isomerase
MKSMKTKDLQKSIKLFKEHYQEQMMSHLKLVPADLITKAVKLLQKTIKKPKGTIYIFGNGGSHAIARHFELTLKDLFENSNYPVRVNCGVDFHISQSEAHKKDYKNIFKKILMGEGADEEDLVILISGSGDSDNLLEAVLYCSERNISTISFSGFDGGKISRSKTNLSFIIPIHDQQICEDATQVLLHIIANETLSVISGNFNSLNAQAKKYIGDISRGLNNISTQFMSRLSGDISSAFLAGRHVFVLGPEGHGLSLSAEHTAHNLNWDAVYQIKNPPKRNITSTPTHCDFSGVGNDRLVPGVVSIQQLDKAQPEDILLLYVHNPMSRVVKNVLQKGKKQKMKIYSLSASKTSLFVAGDVAQTLGHMTCRLVRLNLKLRLGEKIGMNLAEFLIKDDMAQRRLLVSIASL